MEILDAIGIIVLKRLDGFHNEVYLGTYKESKVIVRVSKSQRRSKSEVLEEFRFIDCLKGFANVVEPYAISGASVFESEDKIISLFKYVDGLEWHELEHTDDIIFQAGRQLGLIHKTSYECGHTFVRNDYKQHNDIRLFLKNYVGKEYAREYNDVLELIERITKQQDYFLIHGDYLFSNIIYNTDLTVIDFDDCEYGYYQYDIAVYMFYYLLGGNPLEMNLLVNIKRFELFMNGYRSIREIDYIELEDLNPFFRLRQMKLLGTIAEYQGEDMGEWQKRFVDSSIKRIRERKNFI